MNSSQVDEILYHVAADTIEVLAFMFLVAEDEAPPVSADGGRTAAVDFTGPFSGALAVSVSREVVPELATNMLGLEDGDAPPPEQQEDALKELANVVCGNLLPAVAGVEPVFRISAPYLTEAGHCPGTCHPSTVGTARVWVDSGVIDLALYLEEPSVLETCVR